MHYHEIECADWISEPPLGQKLGHDEGLWAAGEFCYCLIRSSVTQMRESVRAGGAGKAYQSINTQRKPSLELFSYIFTAVSVYVSVIYIQCIVC